MSQIFHQSANTRPVLLAIVLARSTHVTRQHEFIEQPLQFSHMHHVADANASFLEPVRASFRDNRPLQWIRVLHTASILRSTARRVIGE